MKTTYFIKTLLLTCCLIPAIMLAENVSVTQLKTEQLSNPMGIDTASPRLGWQLESDKQNVMQTAYHILVASSPELLAQDKGDIWDSGKVQSSSSQWIQYAGKPLKSNDLCYWKVKSYTTVGESEWSQPATWSIGLLGEVKWKGRWIGLDKVFPWEKETAHSRLSARYLRKEFSISKPIKRATVFICGLGLYELFINGQHIGNQVLTPAPTDYRKTVLYNTFDVTSLLTTNNAIGVTLGNGRYYTMQQKYKSYKIVNFGYPKLRLNLLIEYTDDSKETIATDTSWRITANGPIRSNNEYDGEIYDARYELGDWTKPGYDDSQWLEAERVGMPGGTLRSQMTSPMTIVQTIKPIKISPLGDKYILDLGQNIAGWIRMKIKGNTGDTIRLRFSETLSANGELYRDNFRHTESTDFYICNGKENGATWGPRFVYHGFRFVEISGYKNAKLSDFTGEVVSDNLEPIGTFECSDTTLNRIHQNAWWGILDNYKGMPVDCPQRDERQPWLGDRTMGCWGESFVFDNALLYRKWLQDIEESQREDGVISAVSPRFWTIYAGDVTWPSVYILAAEMLYRHYGDATAIVKHYDSMKRWVEYIYKNSMKDGLVVRDEWGDWCMPPEAPELIHSQDPMRKTDGAILGSTTFYGLLYKMIDFARISGHSEDIDNYKTHAEALKKAYNKRFFNYETAQYGNNSVTGNLLSLRYGLVPDGYEKRVFSNVVEKTEKDCKGHVSTGVVGIQHLMRGLTEHGREDLAYKIVTNTDYPSWGYMIEKGATTIWELWNGDTAAPDMNSANHVMLLGDLLIWYYENLAGIKNSKESVGFRHIEMKPCFPDGLDYVNASYQSVSGKIVSNWTRTEGRFSWNVTIPANCSATLYIPLSLHPEKPEMAKAHSIQCEGDNWIIELGSGNYCFKSDM